MLGGRARLRVVQCVVHEHCRRTLFRLYCLVLFLLCQVMNNYARAEQLSQQADDIEDAMAKELTEKSSNVVLFQQGASLDASQEDVAVIMVSQSLVNIGVIESANSVALTMFGFAKRDLVGKNINVIVPQPMAAAHDEYLMRFVSTGKSVRSGP